MRGDEEAARETAAVFVESLESETLPRLLHEPGFDLVHEFAGLDRQRFSSLLEQNDAALLIKRGEAYFATRQFDLARADWRRATELAPELAKTQFDRLRQAERCGEAAEFGRLLIEQKPEDTMLWVSVPPLAVLSEDDAAYPAVCRTILEIFRQRPTQKSFDRAIKSCLLKPGVLDMTELPIDWLTMSLDEATAPQWLPPWFWSTRALLAYRSGDAELAVKNVNQSEGHVPHDYCHALNMPVLAMAQHQLGRSEQARLALQEASRTIARIKEAPNSKGHHDLLIAEILFQEAEALMKEERPNESGNEKQ